MLSHKDGSSKNNSTALQQPSPRTGPIGLFIHRPPVMSHEQRGNVEGIQLENGGPPADQV